MKTLIRSLILVSAFALALAAPAANHAYCRPTNGGKSLAYAPDMLAPVLTPPTAAEYAAHGWLKNAVLPPSPPKGYICTNTTYEAQGDAVVAVYAYAPAPTVYRKFSKLKIYSTISALPDTNGTTAWQKIQTWLEAKEVNEVNGWMAFQLAQEISEDNVLFAAWAEEARVLLGLTTEQFETLLNACILE